MSSFGVILSVAKDLLFAFAFAFGFAVILSGAPLRRGVEGPLKTP
jgi:hypothetical protein